MVELCRGSVAYTVVDGEQQSSVFQTSPYPALKINRISAGASEAAGLELCVALRPGSLCTTMEQLCGAQLCTYAIFSSPVDDEYECCPVRSWSDARA